MASKIAKKLRKKTPRQLELEARYEAVMREQGVEVRKPLPRAEAASLPVLTPYDVPKAVLDDGMVPIPLKLLRDRARFRAVLPEMANAFDVLKAHFPEMRVLEVRLPAATASRTRRALGDEE